MEPWGAGGDHDALKPKLDDILGYGMLAGFRTGVLDVARMDHVIKPCDFSGYLRAVDCSRDIQPAMAHKYAYSRCIIVSGVFFHFATLWFIRLAD
jgi:hypothetical protein